MSAAPSPAVQASGRLLRVVSALIAQVDPVEGGRAGAMRDLAEDVREVLEESGGGISEDARKLLETAIDTLSANNTTLPYPSAISLIADLSSAAKLVLSSPPSTPFISLLRAELFSRIVHFCQDANLRLRQNTNLALAHTSRSFYLAVRPLLSANAHLWTAGQLVRFADEVEASDTALQMVRSFTTDFKTEELNWKGSSETWAGRRLEPLLLRLFAAKKVQTVRLHFEDHEDDEYVSFAGALGRDCNDVDGMWDQIDIPHLEIPVPNSSAKYDVLNKFITEAACHPTRRSLWLGKDTFPHSFDAARLPHFLRRAATSAERNAGVPPSFHHFEIFAAPFVVLYPANFLTLITPPPSASTSLSLHHLELTFMIDGVASDTAALIAIFAALAPTLSHLTLRMIFSDDDWSDIVAVSEALAPAIATCQQLRSLSIGGHITEAVYGEVYKLSNLEHLVFLPACFHFNEYELRDELRLPKGLRTVTYASYTGFEFEPETAVWYASLCDACESVGATFRDEKRPKEVEWLTGYGGGA